ncbi:hypothetical protein [Lysobacter sp. GCM10012299]|uniref:hypothetical protein n=1 Tax=Lysobacter sp. GCM10012299 TaxID=3317333 RepID=UPI0036196908
MPAFAYVAPADQAAPQLPDEGLGVGDGDGDGEGEGDGAGAGAGAPVAAPMSRHSVGLALGVQPAPE